MTGLAAWMAQFDGTGLEAKTGVSAVLTTVDEEGWPHIAYLSCGEILAVSPARLRLCLWPKSGTARNLTALSCASFHTAAEGMVWEVRLKSMRLLADEQIFMAEMAIVETIRHRAPYANVRTMIDFELVDTAGSLERWRAQICRLRAFAP